MTSPRQTPSNYLALVGRAAFAELRSSTGTGTR
jgi:hypothetical protein